MKNSIFSKIGITLLALILGLGIFQLAKPSPASAADPYLSASAVNVCDGGVTIKVTNNSAQPRQFSYWHKWTSGGAQAVAFDEGLGLAPGATKSIRVDFPQDTTLSFKVWRGNETFVASLLVRDFSIAGCS